MLLCNVTRICVSAENQLWTQRVLGIYCDAYLSQIWTFEPSLALISFPCLNKAFLLIKKRKSHIFCVCERESHINLITLRPYRCKEKKKERKISGHPPTQPCGNIFKQCCLIWSCSWLKHPFHKHFPCLSRLSPSAPKSIPSFQYRKHVNANISLIIGIAKWY